MNSWQLENFRNYNFVIGTRVESVFWRFTLVVVVKVDVSIGVTVVVVVVVVVDNAITLRTRATKQ